LHQLDEIINQLIIITMWNTIVTFVTSLISTYPEMFALVLAAIGALIAFFTWETPAV